MAGICSAIPCNRLEALGNNYRDCYPYNRRSTLVGVSEMCAVAGGCVSVRIHVVTYFSFHICVQDTMVEITIGIVLP